ncbi:hypothetical protein QYF36_010452 [Acer negundo]|nr:hypothetical protein QYF36_010452 [Acer negundo]
MRHGAESPMGGGLNGIESLRCSSADI